MGRAQYGDANVPVGEAHVPVIIVLGPTGAGKSYFINKATGNDDVVVGHSLMSETASLLAVPTEINGQKFTLVDTAGFDDTHRTDTDVLSEIADFLADTYTQGWGLAGVLYMHNIVSPRLTGSIMRNIRMLGVLTGAQQFDNVTLVVGGFQMVESATGERRLEELKAQWTNMLSSSSAVERFDGTKEGAQNILRKTLEKERTTVLDIQREIVDQELNLSETAAGKLIREEIEKMQAKHTHEMESLRREMKEALDSKDTESSRILNEFQIGLEHELTGYQEQISRLEAHNRSLQDSRNAEREQMRRLEDSLGHRLQFLEDQSAPPLPSYEEAQGHHVAQIQASRQELAMAHPIPGRSLFSGSIKRIQILLRPKVPLGCRRLEWTCTCGESLYGDFKEKTSGALDQLAAKLNAHSGQGSQQSSTVQLQAPGKAHTRQTLPVGYSMPGGSGNSNSSIPINPLGNIVGAAGPSSVKPLPTTSLQLCIETGKYSLDLARLETSATSSDGELFARMREQYETTRRSLLPRWARFKRPEKAIFVKFRLGQPHVSIISGTSEAAAIPPASEVSHNYKYNPCPIDEPPMDSRTFFHHFYAPAEQHTSAIWGERLPWKVGPALEPKAHGWGIHLEERPYWPFFTALMFGVVLLSATTAGVYAWRTGDLQTAVGIGTWLTAIQAAGVPVLFFWWA